MGPPLVTSLSPPPHTHTHTHTALPPEIKPFTGLSSLSALTALTALDLGYSCWAHTPSGLAALLPRLARPLRMLNIGGTEGACDALMEVVGAHLTGLTCLDLSESQVCVCGGGGGGAG